MCRIKVSIDMSDVRRSTDRLFHTTGQLTEKLQSPRFVLVRGTCSRYRSADRRNRIVNAPDSSLHRALSSALLWVCYHDNSKLRVSILTKLSL